MGSEPPQRRNARVKLEGDVIGIELSLLRCDQDTQRMGLDHAKQGGGVGNAEMLGVVHRKDSERRKTSIVPTG
jgi:hypothetical protein